MKLLRAVAAGFAICYAAQVSVALVAHFRPAAEKVNEGKRYLVRKGYRMPWSLVPALGALGFIPYSAASLTVFDSSGAKIEERGFDMEMDVYEAYPEVWPEKQKGANQSAQTTATSGRF